MESIRVGVVGLGSMGQKHLATLVRTEGVQVTAIATSSEAKRAEVATSLGVKTFADYHELEDKVDAVVIAVPTVVHAEIANYFIAHGVHVLLEKPIAPTVAEACTINEAAKRAGTVFMVGHIERFNPAYQALQGYINANSPQGLITIKGYRMGVYDARSKDIGVELDLMIHDVDALGGLFPMWRLKLEQAMGMAVVSPLPDTMLMQLAYTQAGTEQGRAVLMASRIADIRRRCMVVEYDGVKAELDFMNQTLQVCRNGNTKDLPVQKAFPLDGELLHFAQCIRDGATPATDGNAATNALDICTRAGQLIMST